MTAPTFMSLFVLWYDAGMRPTVLPTSCFQLPVSISHTVTVVWTRIPRSNMAAYLWPCSWSASTYTNVLLSFVWWCPYNMCTWHHCNSRDASGPISKKKQSNTQQHVQYASVFFLALNYYSERLKYIDWKNMRRKQYKLIVGKILLCSTSSNH